MSFEGKRVAVQGLGNVGYHAARILEEEDGAKIVAVGEWDGTAIDPEGLDISRLRRHIFRLKAEVGQLAAGGITIRQHQVIQPVDQPAAGVHHQLRLQGSRRRRFHDELLQFFGYKELRFRIPQPFHHRFTRRCHFSLSPKLLSKLDPLGKRQLLGPIDGVGLPSHIRLPGIRTGLSASTRFLFPTKCATNLRTRGSNIHIGNAAIASLSGQKPFGMSQI